MGISAFAWENERKNVCESVYIYIFTYIYISMCVCIRMSGYLWLWISIHVCIFVYVIVWIYIYIYIYIYIFSHIRTYILWCVIHYVQQNGLWASVLECERIGRGSVWVYIYVGSNIYIYIYRKRERDCEVLYHILYLPQWFMRICACMKERERESEWGERRGCLNLYIYIYIYIYILWFVILYNMI